MQIRKFAVAVACFGFFGASLFAETLTVTSNADSGEGTLRQLITDSAAGDVIVIPSGMTVTLASIITLPNRSLTVKGADKSATISGGNATQLFEINNAKIGGKYYPIRLEFSDLTIKDAKSATSSAVFKTTDTASTDLVITGCEVKNITGNTTYQNGFFIGQGANTMQMFVTNTTFTGFSGTGVAICGVGNNYGTGCLNMTFKTCRFERNTGIGLFHAAPAPTGRFLVEDSVIANNAFTNARSCIACCEAQQGPLIFRGCTVTNNIVTSETDSINSSMFSFQRGGGHTVENSYIADNVGLHNTISYIGQAAISAIFNNCIFERNSTSSAAYNNYSTCGLFYAVVSTAPGLVTITNCVFRKNISREYCLLGGNGGGGYHIVDTLFEKNEIFDVYFFSGSKTSAVERCAIVGTRRCSDSTKSSSNAIWNSSNGASFRNVLFFDNDLVGNRYLLGPSYCYENCTIVSNGLVTGWVAINNIPAGARFKNNIVAGSYASSNGKKNTDVSFAAETESMGHCYIEKMSADPVTPSIIRGYSVADLGISCVLTTNGSKTVFLDGSRMPSLTFVTNSPLRNAACVIPELGGVDIMRCKRRASKLPDIGCWEFPEPDGLMIFVK